MAMPTFGRWKTQDGHEFDFIHAGGQPRMLAALPRDPTLPRPKLFSREVHAKIPRSSWESVDYSGSYAPVLDQGQHGSCVGHGGCTSFQRAWSMSGATRHDFSACYLYGCINGGRDQGANVTDAMQSLIDKGICLLSTVPEGMVFSRQFPANADAEAQRFRLRLAYTLADFEDMATAILLGYNIALSVCVGGNFNSLDSNGVPGITRGPGNHCVEAHGLVKLPDGSWGLKSQNSWNTSWGVNGCMVLVEGHFTHQPYFEAYAVQAAAEDPQDVNEPPLVIV